MAFCAPPACVRDAMMRVQLEIGTPQDETMVSRWLDSACGAALNTQNMKDIREEHLPQCSEESRTKRQRRSAPELQPFTSN